MEIENTTEHVRSSRTDVCVGKQLVDYSNADVSWRSETEESELKRRKQNTEIDLKNKSENEIVMGDSFAVDNTYVENTNNDLSINESVMNKTYNNNNNNDNNINNNNNNNGVENENEEDSDIVLDVTQQEDSRDWNSFNKNTNSNFNSNLNKISTRITRNKKSILSDEKYSSVQIKYSSNTSNTIKKNKSEGVSTTNSSGIVRARSGLRSSENR